MRHESTREQSADRAGGAATLVRPSKPPTNLNATASRLVDAAAWVLPIPMAVLDREGVILTVNDAWERLARDRDGSTLVLGGPGKNYLRLCDEGTVGAEPPRVAEGVRAVLDRQRPSYSYEYPQQEAAAARHFLLHTSPLPGAQGGAMLAHIDLGPMTLGVERISRRLAREQAARAKSESRREEAENARITANAVARQLERLRIVTDAALSHLSLDQLVEAILDRIKRVLQVDNVTILLKADDGASLTVHTTHGVLRGTGVRVPIGAGIAGRIAARRKPLVIEDLSSQDVINPALKTRLSSLAGMPLLVDDRLIGVLHIGTVKHRHFEASDLELLQLVADRVATALERARLYHLYEVVQARHEESELRANQLDAVFETMTDAVVVSDRKRQVVRSNRAYHDLMAELRASGSDATPFRERLAPLNVLDQRGKRLRPAQYPIQRILRGDVLTGANALDLHVASQERGERELTVSGAPVRDHNGHITGAVAVIHDITERQRIERRTQQALHALLAMAEALTSPHTILGVRATSSEDALARRLGDLARQVLGCDSVLLALFEPGTERLRPFTIVGLCSANEQQPPSGGDALTLQDLLTPEQIAELKAGHVIANMTTCMAEESGKIWALVAPMHVGPELVGLLGVAHQKSQHSATQAEYALVGATAHLAAMVIEHERLLREREEGRARELALQEITQRMDDFLAIASHDLRSPLTTVVGSVQLAALKVDHLAAEVVGRAPDVADALESVRRYLNDADQSVERLSRLVALLFDTSRAQTGSLDLHIEPCDLLDLVQQHLASVRLAHPQRSIQLRGRTKSHVTVAADPDRVGEVLANFVSNAIKYSPSEQPVEVSTRVTGKMARVSVKDYGPGLAAAEQARVWERFYRVKSVRAQSGSASGLGLGLHISKMLIQAHGGQVGMVSAEGRGSTFWFTLPLARDSR